MLVRRRTMRWLTDCRLAPRWYSQYRFYLTLLAGASIIGTLTATSYWGPVGGHGLVSHDLHMVRPRLRPRITR